MGQYLFRTKILSLSIFPSSLLFYFLVINCEQIFPRTSTLKTTANHVHAHTVELASSSRPLLEPSSALQFHDLFTTYLSANIPIKMTMDTSREPLIETKKESTINAFYQTLLEKSLKYSNAGEVKNTNEEMEKIKETFAKCTEKVEKMQEQHSKDKNAVDKSLSISIVEICPEVLDYLIVPSAVVNDYVVRRKEREQPFKGSPFLVEVQKERREDKQHMLSCPYSMRMAVQWWMTSDDFDVGVDSSHSSFDSSSSSTSTMEFDIYTFDTKYMEIDGFLNADTNVETFNNKDKQIVDSLLAQPSVTELPRFNLLSHDISEEMELSPYLTKYNSKFASKNKATEVILLGPDQWIAPKHKTNSKEKMLIYCYVDASNLSNVRSNLLKDPSTPEAIQNWLYNFGLRGQESSARQNRGDDDISSMGSLVLSPTSELYMDRTPEAVLYNDFLFLSQNRVQKNTPQAFIETHGGSVSSLTPDAVPNNGKIEKIGSEEKKHGRPKRSERVKSKGNPTSMSMSSSTSSMSPNGIGRTFQMWQALQRWGKHILLLTIPPPKTPELLTEIDPFTGRTKINILFHSSLMLISNDDALAGFEFEVISKAKNIEEGNLDTNSKLDTSITSTGKNTKYIMSYDDFTSSLKRYMRRYTSAENQKELANDPMIERNRQKIVSLTSYTPTEEGKGIWGILELPADHIHPNTIYSVKIRSFYKYADLHHQSFASLSSSHSASEDSLIESHPNAFSVGPFSSISKEITTLPIQTPDAPSLELVENDSGSARMDEIQLKVIFPLKTGGVDIDQIKIWKKISTEGRNQFVSSNRGKHSSSTRYTEWQPATVVINPLRSSAKKDSNKKNEIIVTIPNLLPATLYEFKATIANEKGVSNESNRLIATSKIEKKSHFKGHPNKVVKEERPYVLTPSTAEFFQFPSLKKGGNRENGGKVKKGFLKEPQFEIFGSDTSEYEALYGTSPQNTNKERSEPKAMKELVIRLDDIRQKVEYSYKANDVNQDWKSIDVWSAHWSPHLYRVTAKAITLPPSNDDWYFDQDYIIPPATSSKEGIEASDEQQHFQGALDRYNNKEDKDWIMSLMRNIPDYNKPSLYPLFLDKIVIVKRGGIPLVEKILRAQRNGAMGIIIVDEEGACDKAFDQFCVQGSNKKDGEGFAASDFRKPWEEVVIPAVMIKKDDFVKMIKSGNY